VAELRKSTEKTLLRKRHDSWHKDWSARDREHVISQAAADIIAVRASHTRMRDPEDKSSAWNRGRRAGNAYADDDRNVWLAVP
jgi:hypothetical protein